ncbi:hypothetical protein WOLCODRAFT_104648 [Wolfiporia cocos MD-104 SS10]|uniref:S-adenosyl-L-methionine-dependent methyltransferase n=1 Tax=Wolfiporia cocos (strain MD-104) TaxID=742152 RepID=A0A2H3JVX7_WOLCO|nr:hypothetical protein WOLCODRAFT_104648 [Wolfiporia cocos MD-104 SS10]
MSMPILFSLRGAKDKNAQGKQEHVERIYRIQTDPKSQVFMTVKEQTSFDLDKKVWDSGVGMSSWLVTLAHDQLEADASSDLMSLKDALFSSEPRDILELGAGTGIVSMTLGTLRHANQPPKSGSIMTTDLPSAMPSLEHNISANETLFQSQSSRPQALVLDWDNDQLPDEVSAIQGGFHAIIMADVTYNTSSFPALVRTLSNLVRLGTAPDGQSSRPPMILLGYKERDPAERSLWDMTREVGIQFEKVGERCGAGGDPVEIWIGTVSQTE